MQSPNDGSPADSIQSLPLAASSSIRLHKQRQPLAADMPQPLSSEASLAFRDRRSNPLSNPPLIASTITSLGSRCASPAPGRSPSRATSGSIFGGSSASLRTSLLDTGPLDNPGDPLNLVLKSFVPHIAIHGSEDADELVRKKGFAGGLWELLRPFGEMVHGKVIVRDSAGGSRSWEDFSVRFMRLGERVERREERAQANRQSNEKWEAELDQERVAQVERVVSRHLSLAEEAFMGAASPCAPQRQGLDIETASPYYELYLRRLLSGLSWVPHETFAHPVACVMAISSRNPAPIEALRTLYDETAAKDGKDLKLPGWVNGDYLRYYVLVHDEERSDITKSMALFEEMKRHLGLHCHMLRIRSTQSAETDDDSIPLPRSDWMTASEELAEMQKRGAQGDFEDTKRYIFESDATAIRTFVREMVTQSVVPTMERNVSLWNDQVASRRRGLSGRFMSLSKRWTFGGGGGNRNSGGSASSSSNYDMARGFYRPDAPEAIMRKLADFAFMLRDWKLAMSTYEILRGDFQNDKAWRYHAATNEMAALALLIMPQNMSSKTRVETINQMLEQAFYSYQTRCSSQYGVVRCMLLSLELLRLRSGSGIDEAVRWGLRLLESRIMGPIGDALLKERMALCYTCKSGTGSRAWGGRRRKSALWSVLSAEAWIKQEKYVPAQRCLNATRKMYALLPSGNGVSKFETANKFLAELQGALNKRLAAKAEDEHAGCKADAREGSEAEVDEESESIQVPARRKSIIATAAGSLETAPLSR